MAKVSECCGAYSEYAGDIDICPDCLEHCEFVDDEDEDDHSDDEYLRIKSGEGRDHYDDDDEISNQAEKAEFFNIFDRTGTYPM